MRYNIIFFTTLLLTGMFCGCRSDIELSDIDKRLQADLGLTLPIGDVTFTVYDFLGEDRVDKIYVDEEGIFHYCDTIDVPTRSYHVLDLRDYASSSDTTFYVYNQLAENGYLDASGRVYDDKKGEPIILTFPMDMYLSGLNSAENVKTERLDSVQVTNAKFNSSVTVSNLGLDWEWINSIDVVLDERQFLRKEGNIISIYKKGDGKGYGQNIPTNIDAFTLNLIKDMYQDPGPDNVMDSCYFTFIFSFTIPKNKDVTIHETSSAFKYHFEAEFIDFKAAWGFFQASNMMRDRDIICISEEWSDWKDLQQFHIRFTEPEVCVGLWHQVAAPLRMFMDTLYVANGPIQKYATWNGQRSTEFELENTLDPITSSLEDSVFNSQIMNHEPDKGHLDELFDIRPDSLLYSFTLKVDEQRPWKQHRITPNTDVSGFAAFDLPFKVNEGSEAHYITKIADVDFSEVSLDSLVKDDEYVEDPRTNEAFLYLQFTNGLPFDIDGKIKFLDKDSNELAIHVTGDTTWNEIHLPAPKMAKWSSTDKYGYISEPSVSAVVINTNQDDLDLLPQCKHLLLDAYVGKNKMACVIDADSYIKVQIGFAANMEAIINLNKK